MQRLTIFFFFDKDGIVRDYITYYLRSLRQVSSHICVVVNGKVTEESRRKLENVSDMILVRENKGFDVWAYKSAMEKLGWEEINRFDELILCNFTCYGPIYPLREMFDVMEKRDCDFWGAVKHAEQPNYLLPKQERGYIHEHVMSCFVVIRQDMLHSRDFTRYWSNVPAIHSKTESTALHETVFTKYFEQKGFVSDSYVDLSKYKGRCYDSSIFFADELLMEERCPLLNRCAMAFSSYRNILNESSGIHTKNILRYISQHTDYDVDLIWDDLLQTQKMSVLINTMGFHYVLSAESIERKSSLTSCAVVIYVPNTIVLHCLAHWLASCASLAKIVLLYDDMKLASPCMQYQAEGRCDVIRIEPSGCGAMMDRLLICSQVCKSYAYCCLLLYYHRINGVLEQGYEDYIDRLFGSLLYNASFIRRVEEKFKTCPRLGCLIPYPAEFGAYYAQPMQESLRQKVIFRKMYRELGLTVPFDNTSYAGSDFALWIRCAILDDFVTQLVKSDMEKAFAKGNFLKYFVPLFVQEYGYYAAFVSSADHAANMLGNYTFMRKEWVKILNRNGFKGNLFREAVWWCPQAIPSRKRRIIFLLADNMRKTISENRQYIKNIIKTPLRAIRRIAGCRENFPSSASLIHAVLEGQRVVFWFATFPALANELCIEIGGKLYFSSIVSNERTKLLQDTFSAQEKKEVICFKIPIQEINKQDIVLRDRQGQQKYLGQWAADSFDVLELRQQGIDAKITNGSIRIKVKEKTIALQSTTENPAKPKRLGIYFFFDQDGIVDDYVLYYLEKLYSVCAEICVVVNGFLTAESEQKLRMRCNKLLIRENKGFDSWAYKEAIESYGYDHIAENYEELILNNFTNYGPIYPFTEMFDIMAKRDCDFWGHNRYRDDGDKVEGIRIIDHLQSYFSVFRKTILSSPHFKRYWNTLNLPLNYGQAILFHELRYTRYFEECGFISDAYMPWKKYPGYTMNAPVFYAYRQMVEDRSPFLKRKIFFNKGFAFEFPQHDRYSPFDIIEFLTKHTDYDARYIYENMKRTTSPPKEASANYSFFWHMTAFFCPFRRLRILLYRKANTYYNFERLFGIVMHKYKQ